MKLVGYIKVKSESTGRILELPVYHGEPIATGTFAEPDDVVVPVGYKSSDGHIFDQIDDHTFKVRDTGEIFRKV